jgi:hypothetical protein
MINEPSELVDYKTILLELHYLPCIDYFAALAPFQNVILEVNEKFQKQTYRNRCYVSGANKIETLIVPLVEGGRNKVLKDIRIDYSEAWTRIHWGCLKSAYGKSPYFEHYGPYFEKVYLSKPRYLIDLNFELLTICLDKLGIKQVKSYSLSYFQQSNDYFDIRNRLDNKKNRENYIFTDNRPYYQTFGKGFLPNLSIVDLLFNTGPEAGKVLFPSPHTSRIAILNKQEKIIVKA